MRSLSIVVISCSLLHLVLAQDQLVDETTTEETISEESTTQETTTQETIKETTTKETPIIWTSLGALRGRAVSEKEATHYEFLGVPYAEPPVGKLRFLPPAPVRPWPGVLEADKDGFACVQPPDAGIAPEDMSEDCLTLNIFTTDIYSLNRPVMLFIHGGGFHVGSKDYYRMRDLIEKEVILVTINYRLHVFGFLSFGNSVVSGNMGLRDQQVAIRWVRENIAAVGGDPDRITIFGESAGAMSVQAQVLSPHNSGLLSGAIAQSGSILFLSFSEEQSALAPAVNTALALGCPPELDQETLECLQGRDIKAQLVNISDDTISLQADPAARARFGFYPVIDNFSSAPFLPVDPLTALMNGIFNPVPYMSGTVKNEAALTTLLIRSTGTTGSDILRVAEQTGTHLPYSILGGADLNLKRIATRYYNHSAGTTDRDLEQPAMDLITDSWFTSYDQKSVELMSRHSKHVYNFYLTQPTNHSLFGAEPEYTPAHGDDLTFLVKQNSGENPAFSEEEKETGRQMVEFWSNFAKYGAPSPVGVLSETPTWFPVTPHTKHYMELKAKPEGRKDLLSERMFFWERLVWQSRQTREEMKQVYHRTAQLLTDYNIRAL